MVQFGKQIQSQQIPGWGAYYLDYKALKKIISSLASSQLSSTSAVRPNDLFKLANPTPPQPASNPQPQTGSDPADLPEGFSATDLSLYPGQEHDPPGADSVFHAHKAAFFFKLERELEKARPITSTIINSFYLLKEGELKLRLATLLSKRKTAAKRLGAQQSNDPGVGEANGVEWRAVHEGFRLLERDLSKLQNFIELNATGFRKILKKWDKRSKSRTKELYLARQVEVQPVFNRELIAELSDTVAACLLDLTNVAVDDLDIHPGTGSGDLMLTQHIALSRAAHSSAILDLEGNLSKAVNTPEPNEPQIQQLLLLAQEATATSDKNHIVRILWKAAIEAPRVVSDLIMASPAFDIQAVDDISGRTFVHEAALSGQLRLVEIALVRGVDPAKIDVYARSALHYAALKGHADVCRALVASGAPSDALDMDNFSPLVHATVNGHLECCRTLLVDGRVNPMSAQAGQDLAPLSLACKHGHKEVVLLLLAHGAASQPNTNGELPLHLAVQEGHAEICRLLLRDPHQDVPDKYNEWTPLFHAARYGHLECVRLLLEAGHNPAAVDDVGRQPIHYAAWFGHTDCMHALALAVQSVQNTISKVKTLPSISPASDLDTALDFDLDAEPIPTLSLPPPIMPFRVYGHNYLDHNYLVQIALGCPWTSHDNKVLRPVAGVELVPRLQGMSSKALPQSNPSLKLVATSNFSATDSSFNVVLPLSDDQDMFSFQVRGLHNLTLEFSVYPSFGSKAIGRGVALSHSFTELQGTGKMILPILDHRLHLIGQVSFDVCIITPFSSPGFDLGSKFETYWKSSTAPLNSNTLASTKQPASRMGLSGGPSSIHASPALNVSGNTIAGGTVITSSLTGEFVHLVVQVTRDLVPVVYAQSRLPVHGFDLSIGNVTYAQFSGLAQGDTPVGRSVSAVSDWHVALSSSFCSLEHALQVLPMTLGVCIELAWAPESNRRVGQTLNAVVDSVLRAVYAAAYPNQAEDPQPSRRKLVLTSFNPFVCTALNWKQPNYPVFFSSYCGMLPRESHDAEASIETAVGDLRQRSISGAVDFARENNLLGVLVDARLIRQVPSIAQAVRDSNILLGSFGLPDQVTASLPVGPDTEPLNLDATLTQGVLTVHEYFPSANQL